MATLISFRSYRNIHLSSLSFIIFFLVLSSPKGAELSQSNAEQAVIKQLTVSAGPDQTIQLPVDQVVLSSFVLPNSTSYKYSWELIYPLNQVDIGNIEGLNKDQVKVSHLKAGNYTFRVTVTGGDEPNSGGSANVTLTVLPPKTTHPPRPPIVVIEPSAQTVQLPNKDAVLDGSASHSPDAADAISILKYDWAAIKVPIGYRNSLPANASILRLKDLGPGLYVFNLTVTDSRNATNSTTASVTVLKEADYPPTANAGPDIVVYLPTNSVTLNGSASTDDKGIASWAWARADDGGGAGGDGSGSGSANSAAVDMDGTSTAFLHLSNLQVGVYKFTLTVTDTSGQVAKAETHVFVKPETVNVAPRADAGGDVEVNLPLSESNSSALLDGSKSVDDVAIVRWQWSQLDGPKTLTLLETNTSIAQIAPNSLVSPGRYNFSLTVWDAKNLSSTAYKSVTFIQDRNTPPKAVGGGDRTVTLPVTEVMLDGSASYDDAEIIAFRWEQMSRSLAYGTIIGNSSSTSRLRLTNLIAGRYLFELTVTDAHGASASDLVSLIVKPPVDVLSYAELVLNYDVAAFTVEQQGRVMRRLEALLSNAFGDSVLAKVVKVEQTRQRRTVLLFSAVDGNGNALASGEVVRKVKAALKTDPGHLSLQVISVESYVCQNDCSSHGSCDPYTKRCMCEAFWMENLLRVYFGDSQSNCEWSILYVIIIASAGLLSTTVVLWSCICLLSRRHLRSSSSANSGHKSGGGARKRKIKRTNRFRYMLIDSCDNVEMVATNLGGGEEGVGKQKGAASSTESDLLSSEDEEILLDTSSRVVHNHRRSIQSKGGAPLSRLNRTSNFNKLNAIT